MEHDRLIQLLQLYCDGQLSADETAELEQELLRSPEAQRLFWEHTSLHGLIYEAAQLKWAETSESEEAAASDDRATGTETAVGAGLSGWFQAWAGRLGGGWKLTGAAATLLLLLGAVLFQIGVFTPTVAMIAQAQDAHWAHHSQPASPGSWLKPGRLILQRGSVQLNFKNGAQAVFEAPAELTLESGLSVFCHLGRFWFQAPTQARGFSAHTKDWTARDLGTEFGLSTPESGSPEVHVFAGHVALQSRRATVSRVEDLLENQAVKMTPTNLTRIPANRAGFLTGTELAQRGLPEVERKQALWEQSRRDLNADPAAILHYTFEEEPYWSRTPTNEAASGTAETVGRITGCAWSEGRWPGQRALTYTNLEDNVRLHLPQRFQAFSSFVWIRVDGLPNNFVHSLMSGDSEQPGTIRWTIHNNGTIRFGLARSSPGPEASWYVGSSPSVIKKELFGQWLMVALVYDGTNATHYLNGKAVWNGSVRSPGDLSFGWVEIGNWGASTDHPDFQWAKNRDANFFTRRFYGRIDEVAVLTRPLSPEEIERVYETGRPLEPATVADAGANKRSAP